MDPGDDKKLPGTYGETFPGISASKMQLRESSFVAVFGLFVSFLYVFASVHPSAGLEARHKSITGNDKWRRLGNRSNQPIPTSKDFVWL